MTLDVMAYPIVFNAIKRFTTTHPEVSNARLISELPDTYSCHIIIVTYYVGKIKGFTPEIETKIKELVDFYHIDQINGIEELKNVGFRES